MMSRLTVEEAAASARRHPGTIRRALEEKKLHGSQPVPGGRWLIKSECLDAWLDGELCEHKQNVMPIRGRRRA